jgi:hypothetical protein
MKPEPRPDQIRRSQKALYLVQEATHYCVDGLDGLSYQNSKHALPLQGGKVDADPVVFGRVPSVCRLASASSRRAILVSDLADNSDSAFGIYSARDGK